MLKLAEREVLAYIARSGMDSIEEEDLRKAFPPTEYDLKSIVKGLTDKGFVIRTGRTRVEKGNPYMVWFLMVLPEGRHELEYRKD